MKKTARAKLISNSISENSSPYADPVLTFTVVESPNEKLARVGDRLSFKDVAQLLELNAQEMLNQVWCAPELTCCGFKFGIERESEVGSFLFSSYLPRAKSKCMRRKFLVSIGIGLTLLIAIWIIGNLMLRK